MTVENMSLVIFTAALTATGNLLLRASVTDVNLTAVLAGDRVVGLWQLVSRPAFVAGAVSYVVATVLWLVILSRQPIGLSYPVFVTCAFLFVTLGATFMLGEELTAHKIIGASIMLAGIVYVSLFK